MDGFSADDVVRNEYLHNAHDGQVSLLDGPTWRSMILAAYNAVDYLCSRGHLPRDEPARARELSGGVSNTVIYVARPNGDDLVLKQARQKLNVAAPWYCSVERIWREVEILEICHELLKRRRPDTPFRLEVPRLLFTDRENYVYAMSAAPGGHVVWKSALLSGVACGEVACACGTLLGTLHAQSWHDAALARRLDDRQFFYDLRLDPFYRHVAGIHTMLAGDIERLIDSVCRERHCLVHGDFSPKNLLLSRGGHWGDRLWLVDFEVGHYGDPAFDLGFFLSHLILKAAYHAPRDGPFLELVDSFANGYRAEMMRAISPAELDAIVERSILNCAGCTLARLDGKSKIDYDLDAARRDRLRELCRMIFKSRPARWTDVRRLASRLMPHQISGSSGPDNSFSA